MWIWKRRRKEAELEEELRFHLEEEASARVEAGVSAEAARTAARREIGNLGMVREEVRAAWGWTWLEQAAQDVRYGLRTMAANRGFSALAVLSLALGIGANTAIFSFMDSILVRSLPVADPDRLVMLSWRTNQAEVHGMNRHDDTFVDSKAGYGDSLFAYPAVEMFRKNERIFSSVFGYQGAGDLHAAIGNLAVIAKTEYVSGNYFQALGVGPAAGRLIMDQDDHAGTASVAVVSHAFGERRFGSAQAAVGQKMLVNGIPFTVIGVAPPEFFGADPGLVPDVYVPFHANLLLAIDRYAKAEKAFSDPDYEWVIAMGRLRPGVTREQAEAALAPAFAEWMRTVNTVRSRDDLPKLVVRDGRAGLNGLRFEYSRPLWILLIVVGLILAIACANIANLLLARATARRREIAVRLSIGAGRWRVVRQLLTESVILASMGGALGIAFAIWGIQALTALLANGREGFTLHADLNWHVLAVVGGLSVMTGVLFGLAPALQATRVDLAPALKEARTAGAGMQRFRRVSMGQALMAAQIAISVVVLVAAGLFTRTLSSLESIQLGFQRENVLTFKVNAKQAGHKDAEIAGFLDGLRARFAAVPGVRSASFSDLALLGGRMFTGVSVDGAKVRTSFLVSVGPGFFSTMQIPILLGREIEARDMTRGHLVAVVNQTFARKNFGSASPIGHVLSLPHDCATCAIEIVGVTGDALIGRDVREKMGPAAFVPASVPWLGNEVTFELRTAGNPMAYGQTVRELVARADPRLPVFEMRSQSALIDGTMNREVIFARLCSGFAVLALAIACVGLYGTMSYNVARRTGEIGIRMALGARRGGVVWMVLREVLWLAAAGLAIGVPAARGASRLVESWLFGVKPGDPWAMAVAAAALMAAAMAAGFVPAWRASRVDPMSALRCE